MTKTQALDRPVLVDFSKIGIHAGQFEVLNDPARFKLLRAGRRWRKTSIGIVQAFTGYDGSLRGSPKRFKGALDGGQIGWWVPSLTGRYIVGDWIPIRSIAAQIPGTRVEEANHRVVMPGGGSIMVLTGDNVDSGRGLGLDGAVLEEAALQNELLWTGTIRPTLIDRMGWALFLFTPLGQNWVWQLEQDIPHLRDAADWKAFHFRSRDNPKLDPDELDALTSEMSTWTQLQEIEAEYVTGGGAVFHRDWIQHWSETFVGDERIFWLGDQAVPASTCRYMTTVDLAWSLEEDADYTVISSWAITPKKHLLWVGMDRGRFEGPDIIPRLRVAYERYGGYVAVERATRQMSIIQEAQRQGLPIRELRADKDKVARSLPAAARMEAGQIWMPPAVTPWWPAAEAEILAFPGARHDDIVDTLAYAVRQVATSGSFLAKLD